MNIDVEKSEIKEIIINKKKLFYLIKNNTVYLNTNTIEYYTDMLLYTFNSSMYKLASDTNTIYFYNGELFIDEDLFDKAVRFCGINMPIDFLFDCIFEKSKKSKNQEVKADEGKTEMCLFPKEAIEWGSKIMEFDKEKYYRGSFTQVERERYVNGALRHLYSCQKDKGWDFTVKDEETGLPAIVHCMVNLAFIVTLSDRQGDFK